MSAYHWALAIVLAILSAALMAGANFGRFIIYLAGILLLGFSLRQLEKRKSLGEKKGRDDE